ncbi:MAG TPA: hypothetical protein VK779_07615, partial [Rhizomicrobium sp.]|nr:hypothetical protein [Rhizomicrobium sp.]
FAGEIAQKLIAAGRDANEPAAIVSDATFDAQTVRVIPLAQLGNAAAQSTALAIIVIGENVRLREGLDWLGAMSGKLLNPDPLNQRQLSDAS